MGARSKGCPSHWRSDGLLERGEAASGRGMNWLGKQLPDLNDEESRDAGTPPVAMAYVVPVWFCCLVSRYCVCLMPVRLPCPMHLSISPMPAPGGAPAVSS